VERYHSSRCHLGTNYHCATISSSQALRTRLFLRGGDVRDLTSLTPHIGKIIYFHVIKANINKAHQKEE
jgi:hypothetical protein